MSKAEDARFDVFIRSTEPGERDWIAFCAFEDAIREVSDCASMVNRYDDSGAGDRERSVLEPPIAEMLFRVLPRVGLGAILADACGVGYAIRFGVIDSKPSALDDVADLQAFEALARKGYGADQADTEMRVEAARKNTRQRRGRKK